MERLIEKTIWMAVLIHLLTMVSIAAGKVIYVDADAAGANDGSSWADAYNYLQDALADANSAEKPVEIRVAQGIYKPDQGAGVPLGDRTVAFQLIDGVSIRGGYAGFGEPDPNVRSIGTYETILSGDLDGNDVDVNDPEDLGWEPTRGENSYHVVTGSGANAEAVLDGFIVTGGNAGYGGGGMYNVSGSPTVKNCTFISNFAGNNDGYGSGGAIYNYDSSPTLVDCIFFRNAAIALDGGVGHGGGMFNRRSSLTMTDCTFRENISGNDGGGMWNYETSLVLTNCGFIRNLAREGGDNSQGGGIWNYHSDTVFNNCVFIGNIAISSYDADGSGGGGIYNEAGSHTLTDCTFIRNLARNGGGLYNREFSGKCQATLTNCLFSGNSAIKVQHWWWARYTGNGGAMYNDYHTNLSLINCTFSGNSAEDRGGAIYYINRATNCIFWSNSPDEIFGRTGNVNYCDVQGGWLGDGNIDADPCFAEPGYWDPNGTPEDVNDDFWVDGDYHLKSQAGRWDPINESWVKDDVTSPCIDAGDPGSPIGLEPFPNGGRINMGAYGGTAEASKSYFGQPVCETIVVGDINGDCKVNFMDFSIMAFHWLEDNTP